MARRLGWTDEEIRTVADFANRPFDEKTKAALRLAATTTLNPRDVPDEVFDEAARHFDPGEIVEIVTVAGLFNYFNRFNNALRVEITPKDSR